MDRRAMYQATSCDSQKWDRDDHTNTKYFKTVGDITAGRLSGAGTRHVLDVGEVSRHSMQCNAVHQQ